MEQNPIREMKEPTPLDPKILQMVEFWAEANGMGFQHIATGEYHILLLGDKNNHPDFIALLGCYGLIHGILTGTFDKLNDLAIKEQATRNDNIKKN